MEEILLIEDNPADIFLIQSYLRDSSFTHRLHKAKSLHEGLEIIQHNNINIVLLDLALDDTAGFNTLRMFQQEVPTIPVIVLTGTNSELLGMQVVRAGAQDYLIKGNFDSKQLIRAIRHSILRFKAQVELREQFFAARQRDKQFQILHNLVKLGTWELDLLDNRMTWSNEMYQFLGYASSSFEPKLSDYLRIVHWEDQDKVKSFFQDAMRHSKLLQMEHRATVDHRSVRHFLLKAQVIATESSDKVILLGALQDITEFRTTSNGLSINAPELEAINRQPLVEYNQLRHLANQLLQLFNNLDSALSLKQKANLDAAKSNAAELLNVLYEQLSDQLMSIPAIPMQAAKVKLVVWRKRIGMLLEGKAWHTKAAPVLNWNSQLPLYVITDEHLLSLLVLNLLQNASHLNKENEALPLNLSFEANIETGTYLYLTLPAPEHPHSLEQRKECLSILNTHLRGSGTPPQALIPPKLQILAKIIRGLNAELLISKKYDLKIQVPLQIPNEISASKNQPLKVLIIEHQTIVQIALKRILQGEFPQVSLAFADDLAKGVAHLTENEYDLVLVDLQLPGEDSFTIVSDLKSTKKIALIALSAELSNPESKKLRQLGVNAFLSKPPQREALLQSLQVFQDNWAPKEQP